MNTKNQISVSLEKIETSRNSSFHTGVYKQPHFSGSWHYHPEFELLLITNGSGKRLVGDHVEDFAVGDLVLLGSLLPHAWIPNPIYLKDDSNKFCESTYVQFNKNIFGSYFVGITELKGVRKILSQSERGIKVTGEKREEIIILLKEMPSLTPFNQLLQLLKILNKISLTEYKLLTSNDYAKNSFYFKSSRMIKVHEYLMGNYKSDININTCAEMSNMTISSFCRFFKKETSTTFSNYLNGIRIDFAKKLLANTDYPVKKIGYECGYNSASYFNKQFKKIVGSSPFGFRKLKEKNT